MSLAQPVPAPMNALTVDVEDYFQVSALAPVVERASWEQRECRVTRNVERLLDLFAERGSHATFFTLGWIAERYPSLIRRIVAEGHELASHGYAHLRASEQSRAEFRQDVLRAKGLLRDQIAGIDCDAFAIPEGGTAMVYVTRQDRREATLKTLSAAFQGVPGIAKVILPAEYETYGYPAVERGRMSDMVLVAEPGYGFDGNTNGETVVDVPSRVAGAHGYLNSDADMNAILVAWGAGIQPGAQLGLVPNVNVAPTIAHLLNVNLPGVDGVLLRDMLRK